MPMSKSPTALVATRLADMRYRHPHQVDDHVCSKCGEKVGIYPSGQAALKAHPNAVVICAQCALADPDEKADHRPAAGLEVIEKEMRESRAVAKCMACDAAAPIGRIRCLKCGRPLVFPVQAGP
jgi:ribosomal protein L40E